MRITASVLRGFIRETLLREASGPAGPLPGDPKSVKNTTVLKQLQKIIGAEESGVYDNATENAWDAFIDTNVEDKDLVDATPEEVKTDWAAAAKEMKLGADFTFPFNGLTFTPDIKGMLSFAEVFKPASETEVTVASDEDDSEESLEIPAGAGHRPYDVLSNNAEKEWPEGATLDSAQYWTFWIDDVQQNTGNWLNKMQMRNSYEQLHTAVENSNRVEIMGIDETEIDQLDNLYGIYIPDVETLDKIFNKGSSTSAQLAAAGMEDDDDEPKQTSHPYMTSQSDPDVWPDANLNVNTIKNWEVNINGIAAEYTSTEMKRKYDDFAEVIKKQIADPGSEPSLYLLGKDADYENTPNAYYYTITNIATLNKIIKPGP